MRQQVQDLLSIDGMKEAKVKVSNQVKKNKKDLTLLEKLIQIEKGDCEHVNEGDHDHTMNLERKLTSGGPSHLHLHHHNHHHHNRRISSSPFVQDYEEYELSKMSKEDSI